MKDGWTDDALECHKLELADAFTALTSDIGGERERQRETEEGRRRGHESVFPHLSRNAARRGRNGAVKVVS